MAAQVGAQFWSGDDLEVIARPEVNAVIVSTSEPEHTLPVLQALERGRPILVEKPIALRLEDADRMRAAAERARVELRVGYSQRSPHATPVLDVLTYWVDVACWYLEGNPPVEVVARGQGGVFREAGYPADDVTWSIVTFAEGAVVSLGVGNALPEKYPTLGQSIRLEVLGTEGVLLLDEDHTDQMLYTDRDIPQSYVPGLALHMAFLGSSSSGDWALGDFWGPVASETRAWLDHLSTGRPCALASAAEARQTLEVTLAIEESARTGQIVRLPPRAG